MNNKLFAIKLKNARRLHGFTMQELADRLNGIVTKQAISKYECGRMMPCRDVINRLCEVLNLSEDYFFREPKAILGHINFRNADRMTAAETERIKALLQDKAESCMRIESMLGIQRAFRNPLNRISITSHADVEKASLLLRKKWEIGTHPIMSVYGLLEGIGAEIVEIELGQHTPEGLSTFVNKNIPLIIINLSICCTTERKRFTTLHELAHLLLKMPLNIDDRLRERYANFFAGAMLCPKEVIMRELGTIRTSISLNEFVSLKNHYGISVAAAVHRAKDLGIITDRYYNQIYNESINKNRLEAGWGGYPVKETTDRLSRLLHRAVLEGIVSKEQAAEISNMNIADVMDITRIYK